MSYFKTKNTIGELKLNGFEGIDISDPSKNGKCAEMVNFRILPDRSLKKRDGFKEIYDFYLPIRGVLSGNFDGEFLAYVVAGANVYKYYFNQTIALPIGNLSSDTGDVSIFCYLGKVYIIDGYDMYEIRNNEIFTTTGYVPLLGKDWGTNYPGEIYEPLNMLTPKARISYVVGDPPTIFLATLYKVDTVDAVYVNGKLVDPSSYSIDREFNTVDVIGLKTGDRVLLCLTFDLSTVDKSRVIKNTEGMVFGGVSSSRLFLWGGIEKNSMFASRFVSKEAQKEAEKLYSDCGGVYFPAENEFYVGDGKHEIKAVSRHYDRLLIFTTGDVWMADSDVSSDKTPPVMRINSESGSSLSRGTAKCGNDPISVGRGKILRWTSNTDTLEDCNAYSISDKIEGLLPDNFFTSAVVFADNHNREILFAYKEGDKGKVLVYSMDLEEWYIYDGIFADKFFEGEKNLCFVSESKLCIFEKGLLRDIEMYGTTKAIEAFYSCHPSDFSLNKRKKHICGILAVAELNGGELKLRFNSESGKEREVSMKSDTDGVVENFYKRFRGERFMRSQVKIVADSGKQQRIYSVTVSVTP